MLGSSGLATFSHSLQLLTTCEDLWDRHVRSLHILWQIMASEGCYAEQINSQQCQGEPSALPAQPGQAQRLGDISLLAVWGSSAALTPAEAGHTPQDIPQGSVVVHLGPLGLAGGTGRCTSALFPPPREDRGTRTGEDSSEAGKGNLRLVIPWVREVAGDELCRAWLSSPARHRCTL